MLYLIYGNTKLFEVALTVIRVYMKIKMAIGKFIKIRY